MPGMPCRAVSFARGLAASAGLVWAAAAGAQAPQVLPPAVAQALQDASVPPESLAVLVQEVGGGTPRLQAHADQPMNPASLFKLVTTAAALELLGPAYQWSTPVWLDGPLRRGTLQGSLVIRGSGDPTLVLERTWLLLQRVRALGVHTIAGDIVLDRSAFAPATGSAADFDAEPLKPYNVQPDALLLNYRSVSYGFLPDAAAGRARVAAEPALDGVQVQAELPLAAGECGDWRSALQAVFDPQRGVRFQGRYPAACGMRQWPVAWVEPQAYDARLLQALWQQSGGQLRGRVREGAAPTDTPPTLVMDSAALAGVVRDINKFSNNVMAQQLFLTLGAERGGAGTPQAARELLQRWLAERFPQAAAGAVVDNGSGLSRTQRLSARLLGQLLQSAYAGPAMAELMSSLPVSGEDGTLAGKRRAVPGFTAPLEGPAGLPAHSLQRSASGRAHLKTGSLRDVAAVAGYVLAASGRRYVLVALVNHPAAPQARAALDALVEWTLRDGPVPASSPGDSGPMDPMARPLPSLPSPVVR